MLFAPEPTKISTKINRRAPDQRLKKKSKRQRHRLARLAQRKLARDDRLKRRMLLGEMKVKEKKQMKAEEEKQMKAMKEKQMKAKEEKRMKAKEMKAKRKAKKAKQQNEKKAKEEMEIKAKDEKQMKAKQKAKKAKQQNVKKAKQEKEMKAKEQKEMKAQEQREKTKQEKKTPVSFLHITGGEEDVSDDLKLTVNSEEGKDNVEPDEPTFPEFNDSNFYLLLLEAKTKMIAKEREEMKANEEKEVKAKQKAKNKKTKQKAKKHKQKAKQQKDKNAEVETDMKTKVEMDMKAKVETDMKAKVETDMKAKVETSMKAKVETDMKAKSETDMKAKAVDMKAKSETNIAVSSVKVSGEGEDVRDVIRDESANLTDSSDEEDDVTDDSGDELDGPRWPTFSELYYTKYPQKSPQLSSRTYATEDGDILRSTNSSSSQKAFGDLGGGGNPSQETSQSFLDVSAMLEELKSAIERTGLPLKLDRRTPAEGNCFSHTIIQQCQRAVVKEELMRQGKTVTTFMALKRDVQHFILDRADHPRIKEMKANFEQKQGQLAREGHPTRGWSIYWDDMLKNGEWADDTFVQATAFFLNLDIFLVIADSATNTQLFHPISGDIERDRVGSPGRPTLLIGYISDQHYQSLLLSDEQPSMPGFSTSQAVDETLRRALSALQLELFKQSRQVGFILPMILLS